MSEQNVVKSLSQRTLCGPFDQQFKRKFLGSRSTSLLTQRNRLLKSPLATLPSPLTLNPDNLLPKIKQIEKIARSGGKKSVKRNKQGEVISELELYLAKKLASNQSTKELITKIEVSALRTGDSGWLRSQNATALGKYSQTSSKFYKGSGDRQGGDERMGQTDYSQSRKWITDQQFRDKFDTFVLKKHQEETIKLTDLFGSEASQSPEVIRVQIESDRKALKQIVKKMIEEHNSDSEMDMEEQDSKPKIVNHSSAPQGHKSIRWILQKCEDFQKSFKIKKSTNYLKKGFKY